MSKVHVKCKGKDFRSELQALAKELPAECDKVTSSAKDTELTAALEYHKVFVKYLQEQSETGKKVLILCFFSVINFKTGTPTPPPLGFGAIA